MDRYDHELLQRERAMITLVALLAVGIAIDFFVFFALVRALRKFWR